MFYGIEDHPELRIKIDDFHVALESCKLEIDNMIDLIEKNNANDDKNN